VAVQKICPVSPEQSFIGAAASGWVGWQNEPASREGCRR
jgi:hypothetical protein